MYLSAVPGGATVLDGAGDDLGGGTGDLLHEVWGEQHRERVVRFHAVLRLRPQTHLSGRLLDEVEVRGLEDDVVAWGTTVTDSQSATYLHSNRHEQSFYFMTGL